MARGSARQQLLAERRLVEGDEVLQFLLGKLVGVDVRHAVADFLFAAGKLLRDDHGDLVEILLVVQVVLQQRILGLLARYWERRSAYIALAFFIVRISLAAAIAAGEPCLSGAADGCRRRLLLLGDGRNA